MRSTAVIAGHPVHPMLIPYPFALLTASTVFDLLGRRDRARARTAGHLLDAGLLAGAAAAVPGLVDYFGTVPQGSPAARQHATWHAVVNGSAMLAFLLARRERRPSGETTQVGLGLSALGTMLLSAGGWLGGELVYHHGIGVEDEVAPRLSGREGTDSRAWPEMARG